MSAVLERVVYLDEVAEFLATRPSADETACRGAAGRHRAGAAAPDQDAQAARAADGGHPGAARHTEAGASPGDRTSARPPAGACPEYRADLAAAVRAAR